MKLNKRPLKLNESKSRSEMTSTELAFWKCLVCELYPSYASKGMNPAAAIRMTHDYAMYAIEKLRKVQGK